LYISDLQPNTGIFQEVSKMNPSRPGVLGMIGNTPLVPITRLNPNRAVPVLAKLERSNPGGSVKDRIALAMIEAAEASGELTPDKIILEATSGNTGIGLAMVAAVKGYKILLTMSEAVSEERRRVLRALGADIRLTPGHLGTDGAIEEAYALAREQPDRFYCPDQYNNPANWRCHFENTGPEIWRQTEGRVTHIVLTMGTTGTLMGITRYFHQEAPGVRVIGVEPYLGHKIQGLKNMKESYQPGIFNRAEIDQIVNIDDAQAYETSRRLAREEGLFVGMSSGAAMYFALELARHMTQGMVVTLLPDGGDRYLSTPLFVVDRPGHLKIFNSLSLAKEEFQPQIPGRVTMYTCGPTVDALMHIGLARRLVVADLMRRHLDFSGYDVTHVINISDIDDRTIARSAEQGEDHAAFTRRFTDEFFADARELRLKPADGYPRASEHVTDMIEATRELVDKGFAYEKIHSVYFDISKFAPYGQLSRVDLSGIQVGKTVELDYYEKENPRDFTLLKRTSLSELKRGIYYKSDWGNVRPGWHIECAVMSTQHLGPTADLHVSSKDLMFPHHENEIAIAEALTGEKFCRYWVHSEPVLVEGKKVGYTHENLVTFRDLMDMGWTGREVRYWLMSHHYRKSIHYSTDDLAGARKALERLDEFVWRLRFAPTGQSAPDFDQALFDLRQGFSEAMDDDLGVAPALAALFKFVRRANAWLDENAVDDEQARAALELLGKIDTVLAVLDLDRYQSDPKIERLVAERERARLNRQFDQADKIRGQLKDMGVELIDSRAGTRWRRLSARADS
jgi:cysteinyl-tRNA synthetase